MCLPAGKRLGKDDRQDYPGNDEDAGPLLRRTGAARFFRGPYRSPWSIFAVRR